MRISNNGWEKVWGETFKLFYPYHYLELVDPLFTSSSLMRKVSETIRNYLRKDRILLSPVLHSEVPPMATRSLTFSLKLSFHLLSKVLLLKGILQFCTARELSLSGYCFFIQRFKSFIYSSTHHACSLARTHRKIYVILPENAARKAQKSLAKGNFTLCVVLSWSKAYCFCFSI